MTVKRCIEVTIKKIEVVAPEIPIQEHWLPLSNIDLTLPPVIPASFFCYKKPLDEVYTYEYMVNVLKKALAKTLMPYYPLAGEMVQNAFGEPEILCNSRGVDFVEAYADVELTQLNFYEPGEGIGGNFVPQLHQGVYAFQATELKCGGLIVGFAADHRVSDAYSSQMFRKSWTEAAQGIPFSQIPSFRRSLLFPLHTGRHDSLVKDYFVPVSSLPPRIHVESGSECEAQGAISRIYYIRADDISQLQSIANSENYTAKKISKLEAFSAFLWKALASRVDQSKENIHRLGIVIDGRTRLGAGDENKLKSLAAYYGNLVSLPFSEKRSEELQEKPLSWVANEIHDLLASAATKEHFLGLLDLVETHRPKQLLAKIYATSATGEVGPTVIVSAAHRDPIAQMDFGWGCSKFSSVYYPLGGQSGLVVTMPSIRGNGDWMVYMHLLKAHLDFLESHAAHIFRPITSEYLVLC